MIRRSLLAATLLGTSLVAQVAAADPTKAECVSANESAQDLRNTGKLRQARATLAICTATSCPGAVREDCGHQLRDLDAAQPTIVFEAKDYDGHDLSTVRVTMDGEPLLDKLDGSATAVDPGQHHFEYEAEGLKKAENMLVVREGEKNRAVSVVLDSLTPRPAAAKPFMDPSARRVLALSLGGAGIAALAVGGVFGVLALTTYNSVQSECGPGGVNSCLLSASPKAQQDYNSASGYATASTIAVIGGGVLAAAGLAVFLTSPKEGGEVSVSPAVSSAGGGVTLRGTW